VPTEKRDELKKASKIQTSGRDANRAQREKDEQEARKASAPTDHQLPLCFLMFMEVYWPREMWENRQMNPTLMISLLDTLQSW